MGCTPNGCVAKSHQIRTIVVKPSRTVHGCWYSWACSGWAPAQWPWVTGPLMLGHHLIEPGTTQTSEEAQTPHKKGEMRCFNLLHRQVRLHTCGTGSKNPKRVSLLTDPAAPLKSLRRLSGAVCALSCRLGTKDSTIRWCNQLLQPPPTSAAGPRHWGLNQPIELQQRRCSCFGRPQVRRCLSGACAAAARTPVVPVTWEGLCAGVACIVYDYDTWASPMAH